MLDFFIALFGGAFLLGKYAKDKAESDAFDRRFEVRRNSMKTDYDNFMNNVADKTLERRVEKELNKYRDYINQVVKDVLDKAIARGYELPDAPDNFSKMARICPNHKLLIAMVSMGKLPYSIAAFGIKRPYKTDFWDAHALFMDWIDKELQAHGVEPMVFQGDYQPKMSITGVRVPAKNAEACYGRFGWWSMRIFL